MTLKAVDSMSETDPDAATRYTPSTTTMNHTDNLGDDVSRTGKELSAIPWPGSKYIIRSVLTGQVITLEKSSGRIVLGYPEGDSVFRWDCVERDGWMGFKADDGLDRFLGYDKREHLCCVAPRHELWEFFCVRQRPCGNYSLLMAHYDNMFTAAFKKLRPVGFSVEHEPRRLSLMTDWGSPSIVWEFIKAG